MNSTLARALVAAALLVPAAAPSASAQDFEGVITMRASGIARDGQPIPDVEYMVRGQRMRVNVKSPMGSMGMIAVPAEKKMYMLMDQQRMYAETPIQLGNATNTGPVPTITRTGKRETIAGYECEHVLIASQRETADVCMAKGIGAFFAPSLTPSMPAWQRQLAADGAFPLKVTAPDGRTMLEVTKIERKKLAAALFDVPGDYTKMDMPRRPPGRVR